MIDLRAEVSSIIQRRVPENGYDEAFKKVSPSGGFTEAVKERILVLLIKKIEELEGELNDLRRSTTKG